MARVSSKSKQMNKGSFNISGILNTKKAILFEMFEIKVNVLLQTSM